MTKFITKLLAVVELRVIYIQIMFFLGQALEEVLLARTAADEGGQTNCDVNDGVRFAYVDDSIVPGSLMMEEQLFQYVARCNEHSRKQCPNFGFLADAVVIPGRKVLNALMTFPDNCMLVCAPQAQF